MIFVLLAITKNINKPRAIHKKKQKHITLNEEVVDERFNGSISSGVSIIHFPVGKEMPNKEDALRIICENPCKKHVCEKLWFRR